MELLAYSFFRLIFICSTLISTLCAGEIFEYKKFVVVVCCYNNIDWVQKNLDSIFMQQYPVYRLIFVDDASSDGTGDFVEQYVAEHNLTERVIVLRNQTRRRKLANLYRALYLCDDNEIVILIDGDDWLISNSVFAYINKLYQDPNVWFTYGQYKNEPVSEAYRWGFREMGYAAAVPDEMIQSNTFRTGKFVFMHLRTFYAWLFKLIKLQDLMTTGVPGYEGDFYPASNDLAMYYPIAEMVHDRMQFVPHVLYIRNLYSHIVGFKVDKAIQRASAKEIRKKTAYEPVEKPISRNLDQYKEATADLIIFSPGNSMRVSGLLESIYNKMPNIGRIFVVYNKAETYAANIMALRSFFNIDCIGYEVHTLQSILLDVLEKSTAKHIFLSHDRVVLHDMIDIGHMIYWLERTWAHAFYLDRDMALYGYKAPSWMVPIDENVCAWKFCFGRGSWRTIHPLTLTLYRKKCLYDMIKKMPTGSMAQFETALNTVHVSHQDIGIFYQNAKVAQVS